MPHVNGVYIPTCSEMVNPAPPFVCAFTVLRVAYHVMILDLVLSISSLFPDVVVVLVILQL